MSAGHTKGPWSYTFRDGECSDGSVDYDGGSIAIVMGQNYGEWRDANDNGDAEFEANARLIVAACNSYDRHFGSRAIEAAEADLLGKLIAAADAVVTALEDGYSPNQHKLAALRAILSQAREVK